MQRIGAEEIRSVPSAMSSRSVSSSAAWHLVRQHRPRRQGPDRLVELLPASGVEARHPALHHPHRASTGELRPAEIVERRDAVGVQRSVSDGGAVGGARTLQRGLKTL